MGVTTTKGTILPGVPPPSCLACRLNNIASKEDLTGCIQQQKNIGGATAMFGQCQAQEAVRTVNKAISQIYSFIIVINQDYNRL